MCIELGTEMEFNRVLGGGVVPGSLVLIGGIGFESDLSFWECRRIVSSEAVLYVNGGVAQRVKLTGQQEDIVR